MFSPEEIEKTRHLLELFAANKLAELSVTETGGFLVEIAAAADLPASPPPPQQPQPAVRAAAKPSQPAHSSTSKTLNSPMVGVFYAAASPGDPPFVNVGDVVTVGQTIGLIEAMKVFSEIPAEAAGRIIEIVAVTGALVQQSEPLFRIEPA